MVVATPKVDGARFGLAEEPPISTSRPAANISSSLPSSAKKLATGWFSPKKPDHVRPQNDAEEQKADHPRDANPARQGWDPNHHSDDDGEFREAREGEDVISDRVE